MTKKKTPAAVAAPVPTPAPSAPLPAPATKKPSTKKPATPKPVEPPPPVHPGVILKKEMEDAKLSISELAHGLNVSRSVIQRVFAGKDLLPDLAMRLAKAFKTTPRYWLDLQADYTIYHLSFEKLAYAFVTKYKS